MPPKQAQPSEAEKFDTVVRRLLSVSHEEIKKRDREWRRKRIAKKHTGAKANDKRNKNPD